MDFNQWIPRRFIANDGNASDVPPVVALRPKDTVYINLDLAADGARIARLMACGVPFAWVRV